MNRLVPFKNPIYITRPILPDLEKFNLKLKSIWKSQWISNNGQQHQLLEKELLKELKVPYLSLFNNGTTALMTAVKSLDIKGEVITTPFTFPATPHCLTWNNLKPVFCDIDPLTLNIDDSKIESLITPKTSAILAVHVFGTPCNVEKIQKIADKHKLKVIYDAAHAFGTEINGKGIGNFGDISMFSFHPTKLFHTGEGGALTCNNPLLKEKFNLLKNFGIANEEEVVSLGINGKMNEIQAALGLEVLKCIENERSKRELIRQEYEKNLKDIPGITLVEKRPELTRYSYQYFVIKINEEIFGQSRDFVCEKFKEYNVYTRKYFFPLCSSYSHYQNLDSSKKSNLPNANNIVKEVLSMPFYGQLEIKDIKKICEILKSFRK